MKLVLDQSWNDGAASLATRSWRRLSKTAVHDGSSATARRQALAVMIDRSARGFGSTQISIATCVVTTVACVPRQPRRDENSVSIASSEFLAKQSRSA